MVTTRTTNPRCDIGHIDVDVEPVDPRVARSRAKVLEAATALLVEHGARGVTVDAVSEQSGVAKSTLYRHWPSRTALLVDVMRSNIPRIPDPDLTAGFEAALRGHVADVAETFAEPEWSRILPALFALKRQLGEIGELAEDDQEHKVSVIQAILDLGVDEGRIPSGLDPTRVVAQLIGPMVFTLLVGEGDVARSATYAVERFLASYER